MVNFKEDEQLNMLNHSCAHLMAQAVKHLYPQQNSGLDQLLQKDSTTTSISATTLSVMRISQPLKKK